MARAEAAKKVSRGGGLGRAAGRHSCTARRTATRLVNVGAAWLRLVIGRRARVRRHAPTVVAGRKKITGAKQAGRVRCLWLPKCVHALLPSAGPGMLIGRMLWLRFRLGLLLPVRCVLGLLLLLLLLLL